jgi:predicted NUDIX family phosphoesterase
LANIVLEVGKTIKEIIDEEIAVVPRSLILKYIDPAKGILFEKQKVYDLLYLIQKNVIWMRRSQAEQSSDYIQLIPVSTFYYKNEILIITNRGIKHGRMAEHIAIWAGGHSRRSDHYGEFSTDFLRHTLARELCEELNLPKNELDLDKEHGNIPNYPVAFVWDNYNPKSARHLGIFYKIYQSKLTTSLQKREFTEGPSKSMYCEYKPIDNHLTAFKPWETWSTIYLKNIYSLDFPEEEGQLHLF